MFTRKNFQMDKIKAFILLSLMLLTSCAGNLQCKFHFKQPVKVINGFFAGCTGTVYSFTRTGGNVAYGLVDTKCAGEKSLEIQNYYILEENLSNG